MTTPTKRKSHDERRLEIARAALDLAGEQGVAHVSTQAIADRLGVSQATVFRHFDTRDAVFMAAIERVGKMVGEAIGPAMADTTLAPPQRLHSVINRHLRFIAGERGVPRLLFSDRLHLESPPLKGAVRDMMKSYAGKLTQLIAEGVADGSFAPHVDAALTAQLVVTLIQGIVLRWSLYDFEFPLEDQGDVIWELIWPALKPDA